MNDQFLKAVANIFHKLSEDNSPTIISKNTESPIQKEHPVEKQPAPKKEAAELVETILGFKQGSDINTKIACDQGAVGNLTKIARAPKRLGEASNIPIYTPTPKTKQEKYEAAYNKLGRYILDQD